MSQDVFTAIDPAMSGTDLAGVLNNFKDALMSGLSGPTRPTELQAGGFWVDTTNDPTTWSFRLWTGSDDIEVFKVDLATGGAAVSLAVANFTVRKVSADTAAAVMELVKRRILSNGQVLSGDVVGEIRMVGRDDSGASPVVAKIVYVAGEDQTTTASGGTLSFYSTPAGTATLVEHLKFIGGIIESIVPHKINSQILVSQEVATTASILKLDASKVTVEMTGSTATAIHGIAADGATKQINIHNRSTAVVTLKHQSGSAAAADRLLLPDSGDIEIQPQETASLIYSDADTRWKAQSKSLKFKGFTTSTIYYTTTVSVPASQMVVTAIKNDVRPIVPKAGISALCLTADGTPYSFGYNPNGQLGLGDVVGRSSPVAVLGNLKFKYAIFGESHFLALTEDGTPYAWGSNSATTGLLGVGDLSPRSSPVAVLGGLKFKSLMYAGSNYIGLTHAGKPYTWGFNGTSGQLGVGDTINRSSPVAVLGGLTLKSVVFGTSCFIGLTEDGTPYAWGLNNQGHLGVGDVIPRSSPVAVLGGLKFKEVVPGDNCFIGLTEDGTAYGWGVNSIGVGDTVRRSSPTLVFGGLKFKSIIYGINNFLGLTGDGTPYAWGGNTSGMLGVGDLASRTSPSLVLGGLKFKSVMYGKDNFIGLTEDGTPYAWGANSEGQLGVGDTLNRSSPVAILGGLKFKSIIYGVNNFIGLTEDGTPYAWGQNTSPIPGTLGVGDLLNRSSPTLLPGGLKFRSVVYGNQNFMGFTQDGAAYGWGLNSQGQLGVGNTINRSSPVAVLGGLKFGRLEDSFTRYFNVTPGNQSITLSQGKAYINGTYIGGGIDSLEITYANP